MSERQEQLVPLLVATDKDMVVSSEGDIYLRKRPLSKQGLFWVSVGLGVLSLGLFLMANTYWSQKQDIEAALRRQDMYYDGFTKEIYQEELEDGAFFSGSEEIPYVRERLNEESLTILEQMEQTPDSVTFEQVDQALIDVESALEAYLTDLLTNLEDLYFWDEVTDDDYSHYQEQITNYQGNFNSYLTAIRSLYAGKANKPLTEQEKAQLADHLSNLLDPDQIIFPEIGIDGGIAV